jgi:hypothetical protein
MAHSIVSTSLAPAAIGPYSQAIQAGGLLFLSGQIPLDPSSNEPMTWRLRPGACFRISGQFSKPLVHLSRRW